MRARRAALVSAAALMVIFVIVVFVVMPPFEPKSTSTGNGSATSDTCTGSPTTYSNITLTSNSCISYAFPSSAYENATLDSPQVQSYVANAYEYFLDYVGPSAHDPSVTYAILNVTGMQTISGTWSTGYSLSYTQNALLNITLQKTGSSAYSFLQLQVVNLPDRNSSIVFDQEEQSAIQVALSNSSVTEAMDGTTYYVGLVATVTSPTYHGDFFVQLLQVDGTLGVGAYVNSGLTAVVGVYPSDCTPGGFCSTTPR